MRSLFFRGRYFLPVFRFNAIHGVTNLYFINSGVSLKLSLFSSISFLEISKVILPKFNEFNFFLDYINLDKIDFIGSTPSAIPIK